MGNKYILPAGTVIEFKDTGLHGKGVIRGDDNAGIDSELNFLIYSVKVTDVYEGKVNPEGLDKDGNYAVFQYQIVKVI